MRCSNCFAYIGEAEDLGADATCPYCGAKTPAPAESEAIGVLPVETSAPWRRLVAPIAGISSLILLAGASIFGLTYFTSMGDNAAAASVADVTAPQERQITLRGTLNSPSGVQGAAWSAVVGSDEFEELFDAARIPNGAWLFLAKVHARRDDVAGWDLVFLDREAGLASAIRLDRLDEASNARLALGPAGELYVAARMNDTVLLERLTENGGSVWSQAFAIDPQAHGRLDLSARSNGVAVAGPGEAAGSVDVAAYDLAGEALWRRAFTATGSSVSLDAIDSAVFVGLSEPAAPHGVVYRINEAGDVAWRIATPASSGGLRDIAATEAGAVYAAASGVPAAITKLADDQVVWRRDLSPIASAADLTIDAMPDGAAIIAATFDVPNGEQDVWIGRYNPDGEPAGDLDPQWNGTENAAVLLTDSSEGIVVAGSTKAHEFQDTDLFVAGINLRSPSPTIARVERPSPSVTPEPQEPPTPEPARDVEISEAPPSGAPADQPARLSVQCVFQCEPPTAPGARYPISQTYETGDDEDLAAWIDAAPDAHARVCATSGGGPAPNAAPACSAPIYIVSAP